MQTSTKLMGDWNETWKMGTQRPSQVSSVLIESCSRGQSLTSLVCNLVYTVKRINHLGCSLFVPLQVPVILRIGPWTACWLCKLSESWLRWVTGCWHHFIPDEKCHRPGHLAYTKSLLLFVCEWWMPRYPVLMTLVKQVLSGFDADHHSSMQVVLSRFMTSSRRNLCKTKLKLPINYIMLALLFFECSYACC